MRKIIDLSFQVGAIMLIAILALVFATCNNKAKDKVAIDSKDGVQFIASSLEQAAALSKKENKPIFLLAHASYCSSCKKMINNILSLKEIGDLFNKNFVNAQIDIESSEGIKMVKDYEVEGTPTLLFLTPEGQVISISSGYQNKEEVLALAGKIKSTNN
ncbi:hypothetical protein BH11BAC5_BH11BAC5_51090 [soil metagenome]